MRAETTARAEREGDAHAGASRRGPAPHNPQLSRRASAIALGLALALIVAKVWGWHVTGSIALLASAGDGLVDALGAVATFTGIRYAHHPADPEHRFGHGKGEALAAFTLAVLLATTGVLFGAQSIWRLIFPEALTGLQLGLVVAAASLVTSGALVAMQTWVLRRTASTAIAADQAHYRTDVVVNLGVLVALGVTWISGWNRADPAFALAIALYMLWNAKDIARAASVQLLDEELSPAERARIRAAALSCPGALAIHDIRSRNAGDCIFIEFHLEVNGELTVHDGHRIVDAAEAAVAALFEGGVEVIGHLEPVGIVDERLDERIRRPPRAAAKTGANTI